MRKIALILCFVLLLSGCRGSVPSAQVVTTTLPTYEFSKLICDGTDIQVTRLITENISCLHDYTLQTSQMRTLEAAQTVVISGAGLEDFVADVLPASDNIIDASVGISMLHAEGEHDHDHHHEDDPHIWLSPANAKIMAGNICKGLIKAYPQHKDMFTNNLQSLLTELDKLQAYGEQQLKSLSCRKLITFHDGFSYFADAFDLEILHAVEEESGSEASAAELVELIQTVQVHKLTAIFTEKHGSASAANIIAGETGAKIYTLDMVMVGDSYFSGMYHNIDVIKEALG